MIQTRRKAPKSTFTMLYAATRSTKRRKQRAATSVTPDEVGEVPGVGIARALVVILLIHVAAIAGIYLHNKGSKSSDLKAVPIVEQEKPPTLLEGYEPGVPNVGENYPKMAQRFGVDVEELRRLNENKPIKAGWKYNIPTRRNEVTTPAESIVGRVNPPAEIALPTPVEHPRIQPASNPGTPGGLVAVEDTPPPRPPQTVEPLLIKPKHPTPEPEPVVEAPAPVASSLATHVVKSGETLWGISRKNKVSVDALMSLNGITNASALKIGAVLKIPAN